MVATYTPSLGAVEQGTGDNNNSWGTFLNGALAQLDKGIAGYVAYAVTGGTLALDAVIPPAGPHPLTEMVVKFTGVLASDQVVRLPNVSKIWIVENYCTGAFTLKFKTTSGSASAAIPQSGAAIVICDGSDTMFVGMSTSMGTVQWLGADGTLAAPGLSFATEPGSGLRRKSAGVLSLVIGGVEIATIAATGIDITSGLSVTVGGVAPVPPGTEVLSAAILAPTGWYHEYGQNVTRAGDPNLMAAISAGFTANTNTTTTLSGVSTDLRNLGLEGAVLEGTGIQTGTTIVSIAATSIVMSLAATNTATGGAVRAFPYGNGDGSTTFTLPDGRGTVPAGRTNMGLAGAAASSNLTSTYLGTDPTSLKTLTSGAQSATLSTSNLPPYTPAGTISGAVLITNSTLTWDRPGGSSRYDPTSASGLTINFTPQGGTSTAFSVVQPTRIRNVLIKR